MSDAVQQIKDRLSIIDVVGAYVKLTRAGKSYKGRSPFTNEKTPSFFVSPDRGMYYCFSSNQGGDIFTFIQKMEGVDFKGALKILAERAGVELVPENPKARDEREALYQIVEDATKFFEEALEKNADAAAYLTSRGVTDKTRMTWRIGYAPDEWRALITHLESRGHARALIIKAGLAKGSDRSAEPYDVFRNRLMFPIADASGRVVAFSGRDLSGDKEAPKYVNSPETPLFEKSRILFGYDKAKHHIRRLDFSLVVEGQFDLVLSHQAGYTNAVAISGTALSEDHLMLLARLSNRLVLALDADRAGVASAMRSARLALARGMDVKVARIEGGKDPADLVREDPTLLKKAIGAATHVVEFLVGVLRAGAKDDRTFRLRVRDEVLPFIAGIPNRIDAEYFEGIVAAATGATADSIHFEVERVRSEAGRTGAPSAPPPAAKEVARARTTDIVAHIYGVVLWQESVDSPSISAPRLRQHLEEIIGPDEAASLAAWDQEAQNRALFMAEDAYADNDKRLHADLPELLAELGRRSLRASLALARDALVAAERSGDPSTRDALLAQCADIQRKLSHLETGNPYML